MRAKAASLSLRTPLTRINRMSSAPQNLTMQNKLDTQLGYILFVLATAVIFVRPWALIETLKNAPIYILLIGGAALCSVRGIQLQLTKDSLRDNPITVCVLGIMLAITLSHLTHTYLSAMINGTLEFAKVAIYFLVFMAIVNTPERLRRLMLVIGISLVMMTLLCVVDYVGIVDLPTIEPLKDFHAHDINGFPTHVYRMKSIGLFSDPNDTALAIVAGGILCLYFLFDPRSNPMKFGWMLGLFILGIGLICTQSRGGLLAAAVALFAWLVLKFGKVPAVVGGVLGLIALPIIAGRQSQIDLSSGTGHERILLWADGLNAIKSSKFFFGIGEGRYDEYADLVAHNSYIHAYVELGFFGGTFFLGCFLFAAYGLFRIQWHRVQITHPELVNMMPYIGALLAGWCMGMVSLSRCYVVPTFVVVAIAASFLNLVQQHSIVNGRILRWNAGNSVRLISGSVCTLMAAFLFVRLFANYG